jgi:hypothetical protein
MLDIDLRAAVVSMMQQSALSQTSSAKSHRVADGDTFALKHRQDPRPDLRQWRAGSALEFAWRPSEPI